MTEGEEFIAEYLDSEDFSFEQEVLIEDLKEYRKADFYLTKYRVYVEYFGQWNNDSQKNRYREKRQVYIKNKIPCIILYPDNLGIIDYIFPKRLDYVLKRYKMTKELRRYYFDELRKDRSDNFVLALIGLVIIYFSQPWDDPFDNNWLIAGISLFCYQTYLIVKSIRIVLKGQDAVDKSYFSKPPE